ncbi:hypothetical protein GCM10010433_05720 [Streptomyces pulveraceus]|uniref:Uncharacterized protein n=1 Tax=Streptomyces pulveraceus TaxID=68258 RepID=A0ABW1GR95_9ACTN
MARLRIQRATWPRPALILTDTPRPACPDCHGDGGHGYVTTTPHGEFDGIDYEGCHCWDPAQRWTLLSLPHRSSRGPSYSDEPPF